jgi:NitT/TauT family transport system ATP-binding protein
MTSVARLAGVEVVYGAGRQALGPFDLDLAPGEIVALVGPSGCGKSTALRLLAGLEDPTRGTVTRTAGRGETSVVFQAPTLMPWADAVSNVALPLELSGMDRAEARAKALDALEQVGLAASSHVKPAQLSGGMAMRVSLARALVTRPHLLLLDEPFAALDEITRRTLADDVHRLWDQTRPAVVFVTHSVEEAAFIAQRIIVMSPGPGRRVGQTLMDAPLPRPAGFRTSEPFRAAAEAISRDLSVSMGAAA